MLNSDTLEQIDILSDLYQYRWGKSLDYTIIPQNMTQEDLLIVLKRIVDTGESILIGYNKLFLTNTKDTFQ